MSQGRVRQDHFSQGRASQGRVSQGRASQGRVSQGRTSQGRVGQGRTSQGRVSQGRISQGRVSQARVSQGRVRQGSCRVKQSEVSREAGWGAAPGRAGAETGRSAILLCRVGVVPDGGMWVCVCGGGSCKRDAVAGRAGTRSGRVGLHIRHGRGHVWCR